MELLEVTLSPITDRRFLAIATRVPDGSGDASTECDLPFWSGKQDLRRTIIKILESSQGFRSENFPEAGEQDWLEHEGLLLPNRQHFNSAYLRRIGQALYQSLFPPDSTLKQVLHHSLRLTEQRSTDLHLRLKFAADSGQRSRLADYPWELLHDSQRFLLHHRVRLSRYIAYEASPPQLPAHEKVQVLLISARPQGLAQLTQAEQQAIRVGLERAQSAGLVQLQILPSPTRKALNCYLTDCASQEMPQVLHFDGHGVFGKRCANPGCLTMHSGIRTESCSACGQRLPEPQGYLAFEAEQGKPDWQSATQVAAVLQPYPIALVVLSACLSGMAVAGDSVFNGMAQNLIDQRIPAVVAMQYSVRADSACDFAEQFYRVLGKKEPLLTALNRGIREMDVEGNQWYRPVLYLRWQDDKGGNLFDGERLQEGLTGLDTQPLPDNADPAPPKLSRLQQLELKRLQDDLTRCERDYQTVTEQLKLEGDGVRQNQLRDQLEVLGQKMGQLEQQIQTLEREIRDTQQSDAQVRLGELSQILAAHLDLFTEMLQACQQLFAIRRYSPNQQPQTPQELIAELIKILPGRSQPHGAIEQFVACLVSCSQNTALLVALQGWVDQYIRDSWQELQAWVEDHQKQKVQDAQPVVLVAVSRSDEASTQAEENRYQIRSWRIQDIDQYKRYQQGYSPIEIPGSTGEETYTVEELVTAASRLLLCFLWEGDDESVNSPEIHIFLPLELMNLDVDCWLLDDGYGRSKPLGHEYKVVLRCTDRLSRSYRQRPRWVKKWRQHGSLLEKTAFEVFAAGDDSDLDELAYTLDEIEEAIVGLKVMRAPTQAEPDGLFGVLLQSGLPLAVWGRCDLRESTNAAELDRVLQACCLEHLPSTVKQERRQSRKKEKECHIGHHLSLLWDDPHLVPPKSA